MTDNLILDGFYRANADGSAAQTHVSYWAGLARENAMLRRNSFGSKDAAYLAALAIDARKVTKTSKMTKTTKKVIETKPHDEEDDPNPPEHDEEDDEPAAATLEQYTPESLDVAARMLRVHAPGLTLEQAKAKIAAGLPSAPIPPPRASAPPQRRHMTADEQATFDRAAVYCGLKRTA